MVAGMWGEYQIPSDTLEVDSSGGDLTRAHYFGKTTMHINNRLCSMKISQSCYRM